MALEVDPGTDYFKASVCRQCFKGAEFRHCFQSQRSLPFVEVLLSYLVVHCISPCVKASMRCL